VAPAIVAVVASVQNVSATFPEVKVQHLLSVGSVQSGESWQKTTVVVEGQPLARCVGQLAADEQADPSVPGVQFEPDPVLVSVPQQLGVAPPHSSGPSQLSESPAGHIPSGTHEKGSIEAGLMQHTWVNRQSGLLPHGKSYVPACASPLPGLPASGVGPASGVWPESVATGPESLAATPESTTDRTSGAPASIRNDGLVPLLQAEATTAATNAACQVPVRLVMRRAPSDTVH
jgi:hypothetical protein